MLDVALTFLVKHVNTFLELRTGGDFGSAVIGAPVDDTGKWSIASNRIGASVINVEEERVLKAHLPETRLINGRNVAVPAELKLNVVLLFAARFQQYDQALKYLSLILTCFQANPTFTPAEYPGLDPRIERLTLELQTLTYEQLNQVWAFVGGKQLPAAIYRVRLVVLQDQQPLVVAPPASELEVRVKPA